MRVLRCGTRGLGRVGGSPFLSPDDKSDFCLEMKDGEQKKSGWDTDGPLNTGTEEGLKKPHCESKRAGDSVHQGRSGVWIAESNACMFLLWKSRCRSTALLHNYSRM